ncbi:MAG: phage terminase large subunit [Clostridia bacterium]|nr:phage terminase large subunit [Clostridia bacterium]
MRIPYAPLNEKQARYIRECAACWLNVAEGGKRAGKNIMNLLAWAGCLENHPDTIHLAAGVSLGSAKMNILDSNGFGLQYLFDGRCRMGRYMSKEALYIRTASGEKIVIFAGGGRSCDAALIKGNSYGSAYITEVNECHRSFVQEVLDRTLASRDRKLFMDLNPKPPRHWFYAEFLDRQEQTQKEGKNPGFHYGHFTIADNMSISDDQLRAVLKTYDRQSVWYKADILGRRAAASGRIYAGFSESCLLSPAERERAEYCALSIGVDVGGTDATAATLCAFTRGFREAHLIDGLYHRQGINDKMSEDKYVRLIADWIGRWAGVYPMNVDIYVDSAAKLFRAGLRDELMRRGIRQFSVKGFDKGDGINERISLNAALLSAGRFRIAGHMKQWIRAYQDAVWSQAAYEKGEWERLDDGSYPVDCLDSAEYGFYPFKRFLQ